MPRTDRRATAHEAAIIAALRAHGRFVSAQQLHLALHASGHAVGLATVYRRLHALESEGVLDAISVDGETMYKSCAAPRSRHHHHLVCERCGESHEIDPPPEAWIERAAASRGYTGVRHILEVFGVCRDCAGAD